MGILPNSTQQMGMAWDGLHPGMSDCVGLHLGSCNQEGI